MSETFRRTNTVDTLGLPWIVCQIGAREHYSIARALHKSRRLAALVTDMWVPPSLATNLLPSSLVGRFHTELADAVVAAPTFRSLMSLLKSGRGAGRRMKVLQSNRQFQVRTLALLERLPLKGSHKILFSYSYAASELFRYAKRNGWASVLGQIDPGPPEERIVAQLAGGVTTLETTWRRADPLYWSTWREEISLADRVIVNSEWSQSALVEEGVPIEKIKVVPLSFAPNVDSENFVRSYPAKFDWNRPLRVLFLGQINLRKGAHIVFDVSRSMRELPVEFYLVGPVDVQPPDDLKHAHNVRWIGPVPRNATDAFYKSADVFLFPTLSDGFGLTQLEAQSWKLPVVSSRYCGTVVIDGVNGQVLQEVTSAEVTAVLLRFLHDPKLLIDMSARARVDERFGMDKLTSNLLSVANELGQ
jgi:glycosyltransferase involved in cell wall biosynthesis